MYSEQDLKHASEFRDEIHREALEKIRAFCPAADRVVDGYPADAYFQKVWDYPGKWYTMVGTPPEAGGRQALIGTIVRETLEYYRNAGAEFTDDEFYRLIAEYPGLVCDYFLVNAADRSAEEYGVFPYRGEGSHRLALACAVHRLFARGGPAYDIKAAGSRKLSGKALFAPAGSDEWMNYRKAFLSPIRGARYTDIDFERVNAVLFPCGAEGLDVRRWTAERAECSGEGNDFREVLCLTVYDKTLDRFVVITASAHRSSTDKGGS